MYFWYFCSFAVKKQDPASCNWDVDDNYTIYMHTVADIVWNGWQTASQDEGSVIPYETGEPLVSFRVDFSVLLNQRLQPWTKYFHVLLQLLSIHLEVEDEPISIDSGSVHTEDGQS